MKRTTLVTLGLSIAACTTSSSPTSSSSTSPATTADYEDTAQAIASSTAPGGGGADGAGGGEVVAMADAMSIALGRLPLGFLRASDGHYHGTRMGVANDMEITCKNAAGTVLATCDHTTDSATVQVKFSGEMQTPNFAASVDREGTWTITGLQSATATVDGDSSFSFGTKMISIFHQGVTSTYTFDTTATYDAIKVATQERQVTGGTVSFEVKAHRTVTGTPMGTKDVDKSFDVHAQLTFNADHTATLVLDGTQTFTIDLTSGRLDHMH